MRLSHRPVEPRDLDGICGFPITRRELFFAYPQAAFPLAPDQLQRAIAERCESTVVLADGAPVGFANFICCQVEGTCFIGNVMVAPHARGQGVGSYLMRTMLAIAFERYRARQVRLSCFGDNVVALLLYRKLGFRPFDLEERLDKRGERVVLFHLRLYRKACMAELADMRLH